MLIPCLLGPERIKQVSGTATVLTSEIKTGSVFWEVVDVFWFGLVCFFWGGGLLFFGENGIIPIL